MADTGTRVYDAPTGPSPWGVQVAAVILLFAVVLGYEAVQRWADYRAFATAPACQGTDSSGCVLTAGAAVIEREETHPLSDGRTQYDFFYRLDSRPAASFDLAKIWERDEPPIFRLLDEDTRIVVTEWDDWAVRVEVPGRGSALTIHHPLADAVRATLKTMLALASAAALLVLTRARRGGWLARTVLPFWAGTAAVAWAARRYLVTDTRALGTAFAVGVALAVVVLVLDARHLTPAGAPAPSPDLVAAP